MNQPKKAVLSLPSLLILFVLSGCGSTSTREPVVPTKVVFPQEWREIYPGMSSDDFFSVMGPPRKFQYSEPLDGPPEFSATYSYPFAEYFFTLDADRSNWESGPKQLILSNRLQSCSYAQDENGAFEAFFPVSKKRAKELFANSAVPLGFAVRNMPDDYSTMARPNNRYHFDLSIEALLNVRFTESTSGTNVFVNTESTEIVWKSRDHSYAKAMLLHMHCTRYLFEKNYGLTASAVETAAKESNAVTLVNYRMVSSRSAVIGDAVEYKIAGSADVGGIRLDKGGSAWGEVVEVNPRSNAGDVIIIRLKRIQAANGRWYAIKREDGSSDIAWQSHDDIEPAKGTTLYWARSHSIYQIGEMVNVVVGEPMTDSL